MSSLWGEIKSKAGVLKHSTTFPFKTLKKCTFSGPKLLPDLPDIKFEKNISDNSDQSVQKHCIALIKYEALLKKLIREGSSSENLVICY